ncbi:glycine-rich domain-containing protein [Algoriphagus sp. NG3]|uniref:glycine-rich domain-containing protein n=1 Tax=Algoriphagus sp. NG3 TaxID=3097546 RepID=UPI002A81C92D|nr:hypothetical protein [Algoriphagus sp. NG3]WPR75296.1 hypothetical protein SLW71_21775 [Algoriphagus sp. NG3]
MKNQHFLIFLIICIQFLGVDCLGQVYTTTGNSTNWNDAAAWSRTNPTGCPNQNGGPPPPRTLNQGNACPVKIIINHPITFTGSSSIGGGFMDSLIVNTGGNLTFTGNLDVTNTGFQPSVGAFSFTVRGGGILNVNGNFTNQNGTSIRVQSAGQFNVAGNYNTTGTSSSLTVDPTSSLSVGGATTINSNHSLSVTGNFTTNTLSTGGGGTILFNGASTISVTNTLSHINGSITMSATSNLFVGGNLDMNGSAILNLSGDTDIKVLGNLNLLNGIINNSGNGDIRIDGNISMSGGGTYNGSNNSYIQANGNHVISANNPVNLSGDAKFVVLGDQTGGFWGGPSSSGNSCYRSNNRPNSLCLPCNTTYSSNSSFFVPAGVTQITIEMVGGGGRGGNRTSNGRAGGGGGGAYSRINVAVTPGETLGVFVGSGGNQTTANGGISYVTRNPALPIETGSILFAGGGNAGADGGAGGAGGTRDNRTTSFAGGNGANASNSGTLGSGGGGSAGGSNAAGNNGGIVTAGANPQGIGGPGGDGTNGDSNGSSPLSGFGGGGGGARRNNTLSTGRIGGNGASGHVIISYTCPANTPCSRFLDFGTSDGFTIIEYVCSGVWNAPEGLEEFSVTSIGGGGGGGFGSSAGGGGGGAIVTQTFSNINQQPANPPSRPIPTTYGFPENTNFTVTVGNGGNGATNSTRSTNGNASGISGNFQNYANTTVNISSVATGGGGGGSSNNFSFRNGSPGGSGGGAARQGTSNGNAGTAGNPGATNVGGNSNSSVITSQGGGGGGAGSAGSNGDNTPLLGVSIGGNGGNGSISGVPGLTANFAAGGGGTATGGFTTNIAGSGGSGGGGNGNNSGLGLAGGINTGSGGGAGSTGGGNGGSGRVFIYYQNFRILPVEYLYFKAVYNSSLRSGDLAWATAKEWENSHFEIERSVNDVKLWKTIGQVTGAGYSEIPTEYTYQDIKLPLAGGNIFYRLKQFAFDGDSTYSETRAIQVAPIDGYFYWRVFPNPTSGDPFKLELIDPGAYKDESITVRIISGSGKFGIITSSTASTLSTQISEWLRGKAAGVYTLEISWGIKKEYHKVILRR